MQGNLRFLAAPVVFATACSALPARAQVAGKADVGWFNSTELSYVFTEGNSDTETLGFKNSVGKSWTGSHFELKLPKDVRLVGS